MTQPKKFLLSLLALFTVLLVVILIRTLATPSLQLSVPSIAPLPIDDSALERLAVSIRFPTINATSKAPPFQDLRRHLETSFPLIHKLLPPEIVSAHSLLFTWPGKTPSAPPILLLAHLDVVPVEPRTETAWKHPPFSGAIADGFICGRGALDDKAGLLAILEAVETLLTSGFQPTQTIYLAFGHDEETGGSSGASQIAALLRSRGVTLRYVLDEGSAITHGIVPGVAPPVALIGVAEKGYASIQLSVTTPGGHSSMPPPETAIGILAAAVLAVETQPMPFSLNGTPNLMFDHLGPEMSLTLRTAMANRWLFAPLIKRRLEASPATAALLHTTTALTMFKGGVQDNVLPSKASAVINARLNQGDSLDSLLTHTRKVVNDKRVTIQPLPNSPSKSPSPESSTRSQAYKTIERTIREVIPEAIAAPSLILAGTDSHHYQSLADDVYRFRPFLLESDDVNRIHGANERISITAYKNLIRFYVRLLTNDSTTPN